MSSDLRPDRDGNVGSQVGVVGRPEVVTPFRAAGLAVFPVEPGPEATARVEELAGSGLTVLFYTEDLYPYLAGAIGRFSRTATPCLVMLPMGEEQHASSRLREVVRRSVGADVFGRGPAKRQIPRKESGPCADAGVGQEIV